MPSLGRWGIMKTRIVGLFSLRRLLAGLAALSSASLLYVAVAVDVFPVDQIVQMSTSRYGPSVAPLIRDWFNVLNILKGGGEQQKLKDINEYLNRKLRFVDDQTNWGQADYWATPVESLMKGAGDCEDFAIAKYVSLKMIGVPVTKLRITYVKARIGGVNSPVTQAHMVLTYYSTPDAEPLVLDNLIGEIRPASRRPDLIPIFSFNSEGVFNAAGEAQPGGGSRLSRWNDLLEKMKSEGLES